MAKWYFNEHMTNEAKLFTKSERKVVIEHFLEHVMPSLSALAYKCSYGLAIHGSRARDLDLIAVPWEDDSDLVSRREFVILLAEEIKRLTGWGHVNSPSPTVKAFGRVAYTIVATADINIDLSITPMASEWKEI